MSESVTALQRTLAPLLKPVSWLYGGLMQVRADLYRRGLLPRWEAPVLTVSVGNIGWGGSGKTPLADWLLGWAESQGIPVALLTRGYRAKPVSLPYVVKPGALAEEAGDEPLMLACSHEKAVVVVDPDRTRAGKMVMKNFKPELIILDDGFQHMAVQRHLNLVLLKPQDVRSGWNSIIPAGTWREPVAALERADAFLLKIGPKGFAALKPHIEQRLERFNKPVFSFQIMPTGLRKVLGGETARDFSGGQYLLVTGVGDPAQVKATATAYFGYAPLKHMAFRDHHFYTKHDVLEISETARKLGCRAILCTPKDAVKLGAMSTDEFWQFDLRLEFGPSAIGVDTPFSTWWDRRYDAFNLRRKDRAAYAAKFRGRSEAEKKSSANGDTEND